MTFDLSRRGFLRLVGAIAGTALIPPAVEAALAVPSSPLETVRLGLTIHSAHGERFFLPSVTSTAFESNIRDGVPDPSSIFYLRSPRYRPPEIAFHIESDWRELAPFQRWLYLENREGGGRDRVTGFTLDMIAREEKFSLRSHDAHLRDVFVEIDAATDRVSSRILMEIHSSGSPVDIVRTPLRNYRGSPQESA